MSRVKFLNVSQECEEGFTRVHVMLATTLNRNYTGQRYISTSQGQSKGTTHFAVDCARGSSLDEFTIDLKSQFVTNKYDRLEGVVFENFSLFEVSVGTKVPTKLTAAAKSNATETACFLITENDDWHVPDEDEDLENNNLQVLHSFVILSNFNNSFFYF